MNKLTIEDKKIIAENVHGWGYTDQGTRKYFEIAAFDSMQCIHYNPDQDVTQFVEMIEALDGFQTDYLSRRVIDMMEDCFAQSIQEFKWLCKHKYEVCKAIIEVIKQKE